MRAYVTIIHHAAALFESLVQIHPFVNGNKRVAFAVVDVFLRISGYAINANSAEIHGSMNQLFEGTSFDIEHLAPWLQKIASPNT